MNLFYKLFLFVLFSSIFVACISNKKETSSNVNSASIHQTGYDSVYALSLGADNYGMKSYVMAFLKDGPNKEINKEEQSKLMRAHLDNISKMAEKGKLVLAGPFYSNPDSDLRGIYIFNVSTLTEAEELTNTDPAVQAGSLSMELFLWYGSAALMEVNSIHNRIAKEKP